MSVSATTLAAMCHGGGCSCRLGRRAVRRYPMCAHHALVALRRGTLGHDVAFARDGCEVDFPVQAVADAGDEELELVVGGEGGHGAWLGWMGAGVFVDWIGLDLLHTMLVLDLPCTDC